MVTSIQDWRFKKLDEGEQWEVSRVFSDVGNGDVKKVFVSVPDEVGDLELSVEDILLSSEGKLLIQRFRNVSEDAEGSDMLVSNKKIGVNGVVPFNFRTGGDGEAGEYSDGVLEEENLVTGAVSGNKVGGGSESRPALIVDTGNNYLLVFDNQSGQTIDFSVQIEFAEVEK